jgi:Ca2+-binding EF-hand superfamily protein
MKETLYITISLSEADALIKEFDSDADGRLTESEFFNFLLPATSFSLRDIALKRSNV